MGADQIGEVDNEALFKPGSKQKNIDMLKRLQDREHYQHAAASLFFRGKELAPFFESVKLTMRPLSEQEIEAYVAQEQPWQCAGGYRFEGLGMHLFTKVAGSVASVIGLPLLPILNYLHDHHYINWEGS